MKSLNLQFKGRTIYLFTGVISATVKRLDVSGFFLWPTRRRSSKEDYMHHRDVKLKATENKGAKGYFIPPTGDSLKRTYTGMCRSTEYGFRPLCPKQDIWMYEDVTIEVL